MKRRKLFIVGMLFVLVFSSCSMIQPLEKPEYDGQNLHKYHKKLQRYYTKKHEKTGSF